MIPKPDHHLMTPQFSGAVLDLLHLIKNKTLLITDLTLSDIVAQYAQYVDMMLQRHWSISVISEDLSYYSSLILLRSRESLPLEPSEMASDKDESLVDQHLTNLIRYKKIQALAGTLKVMQGTNQMVLGKETSDYQSEEVEQADPEPIVFMNRLNVNKLTESFLLMVERLNYEQKLETKVMRQEVSPHALKIKMLTYFHESSQTKWPFNKILVKFGYSLTVLITAFLVVLELIAEQTIILQTINKNLVLVWVESSQNNDLIVNLTANNL